MNAKKSPIVFTIVIWIIWAVITLGGNVLQTGGNTTLEELASSGPLYAVIAAAIFVLVIVAYKNWWRETGFKGPDKTRYLRYLIFPSLLLLILLVGAFTGHIDTSFILIILFNTFIVGISEEVANRGILLHGFTSKYGLWTSMIWVSILFGAVHAFNGFITGDFGQAFFQAFLASLSGFWYGALRIRLTTITPAIILHGLWDFSVFIIGAGVTQGTVNPLFGVANLVFIPILFLYGIWMLRSYQKEVLTTVNAKA